MSPDDVVIRHRGHQLLDTLHEEWIFELEEVEGKLCGILLLFGFLVIVGGLKLSGRGGLSGRLNGMI